MPPVDVTPNTTIAELLAGHPAAARILVAHRMHCVGCAIAPFEAIADACDIYGVDVDELFVEIHRAASAPEDRVDDERVRRARGMHRGDRGWS